MRRGAWTSLLRDHAIATIAARSPAGVTLGALEAIVTSDPTLPDLSRSLTDRVQVHNAIEDARHTPGVTQAQSDEGDAVLVLDDEIALAFTDVRRAVARFEVHRLLRHEASELWARDIAQLLGMDEDVVVRALRELEHAEHVVLTRRGWSAAALKDQRVGPRASLRVPIVTGGGDRLGKEVRPATLHH